MLPGGGAGGGVKLMVGIAMSKHIHVYVIQ